MKRKVNFPFLFSAIIFVASIVAMFLYIFRVKSEDTAFEKVRDMVKEVKAEEKEGEKKREEGLDYYLIDGKVVQEKFKDLYLQNSDFIGWIKIDNTPIDYPVMYTPDDEQFYIHRDFDKNYSFGGCIFAGLGTDVGRTRDNIITYGHHMIDSSMYHDIDKYEDEKYYKEHKYIRFDSLYHTGTYEVIAAFRTEVHAKEENYQGFEYWKFVNAGDEKEYDDFVNNCKSLTPYKIDTSAEYGDQLITLSTCAYHTVNGRFVVVAKRMDGKEIDREKGPIEEIKTEK